MSTPYAESLQLHARLRARLREAKRAGDVSLCLRLVRLIVMAHLRCDRRQEKCGSCGKACPEGADYAESEKRGRICRDCYLAEEAW